MTQATQYRYIELDETGTAIISGTTMKVIELITGQIAFGWSPEELHFQHPYSAMSQIHSVLAYHWDHKEELDAEISRQEAYAKQLRQRAGESPLVQRLRHQGLI